MKQLYIASIALSALFAATWWCWHYRRINIGPLLSKVIAAAIVAGRLIFVLTHLDVYAAAPLRILDLSDGGFADVAALFAAFATAAHGTARSAALRKPLAIALASGACAWALTAILFPYFSAAAIKPPEILLRTLDGNTVNLVTFRGKPLVINLWASWCPPCRREIPLLEDAQRTRTEVQFVFVNQGEEAAAIARFLHGQNIRLHNVFADRLSQVGSATNSIGMPTTLFFNRRGELVVRHVGEIDAKSLAAALAALERKPGGVD
ncbi:MAG: TlpA disulfide reductase family protein [Pseudomonadota bacterium]